MDFFGELMCFLAAVCWAISVCLYRNFSYSFSSLFISGLKSTVALFCLGFLLFFLNLDFKWNLEIFLSLFLSGLIGITLGDTASLSALKILGAPLSAAGLSLAPPLVGILSFFFLSEVLKIGEWLGLFLTVFSVALAVYFQQPSSLEEIHKKRNFLKGVCLILLSALANAIGILLARHGFKSIEVFWGTFFRILPTAVFVSSYFAIVRPKIYSEKVSALQWVATLSAALIGTFLGVVFMSVGLKQTKAALASAILATYPVWVLIISKTIFKEKVKRSVGFFILLAVLGVFIMVFSKSS